jgi:hypothetical protein
MCALPLPSYGRYERTAGRHWDLFYKRNQDRFFKDRHYLLRDFPDLVPPSTSSASASTGENGQDGDGGLLAAAAAAAAAAAVAAARGGGGSDDARPMAGQTVLVEAGCGVGNAVFPLLESHPAMFVVGAWPAPPNPAPPNESSYTLNLHPQTYHTNTHVPTTSIKYALDLSTRAIELVKQHPLYAATGRCRAFVCDLVKDPAPAPIVEEGGGTSRAVPL